MRRTAETAVESPNTKRRRFSSPSFDDQELSQEDLDQVDEIERKYMTNPMLCDEPSQASKDEARAKRLQAITNALNVNGREERMKTTEDIDNPFTTAPASRPSRSISMEGLGFTSASTVLDTDSSQFDTQGSESLENPPEKDYSSWFEPATDLPPVQFQAARVLLPASEPSLSTESHGFRKASDNGLILPSKAALEEAAKKLEAVWDEDDASTSTTAHTWGSEASTSFPSREPVEIPITPMRPAFRSLGNAINSPQTPSPLGTSRPILGSGAFVRPKATAFKPPLLSKNPPQVPDSVALNSIKPRPAGSTPSLYGFSTPKRGVAGTSLLGAARFTPPRFVTPFKPGMRPGESGCVAPKATEPQPPTPNLKTPATSPTEPAWLVRERKKVLPPDPAQTHASPSRLNLSSCGMMPQAYTPEHLEGMGINHSELAQITPSLAMYYSFHTPSSEPPSESLSASSSQLPLLGPDAALQELLDRGCTLATKPWVDNHWGLILWKLAGMVALDPLSENDPKTKRWCWAEVLRQLMYRYYRELDGGKRPALRQIATRDVPASCPLVLCISDIVRSEGDVAPEDHQVASVTELEVTDGWYRLRAQIDAPLERAIRRGVIKVGRKLGVSGARLFSERKDPVEVLDAYNSTKLILTGNSTNLVPWHAKLGLQKGIGVKTLHSLSPDGGTVPALDFIVVKVHPVAYLEFIVDEEGNKRQEGPRNAAAEASAQDIWQRRRQRFVTQLQSEFDKKLSRLEDYLDRLERKALHFKAKHDEEPPPNVNVESLFEELAEEGSQASSIINRLSHDEAGWLALYMRSRQGKDRDQCMDEMTKELDDMCPPRDVRSFRVVVFKDAHTARRPANRTAHLTIWDVMNLSLSEGSSTEPFEAGKRYMVTNVYPTLKSSWMDRGNPGAEVYLATSRTSRWTALKK